MDWLFPADIAFFLFGRCFSAGVDMASDPPVKFGNYHVITEHTTQSIYKRHFQSPDIASLSERLFGEDELPSWPEPVLSEGRGW